MKILIFFLGLIFLSRVPCQSDEVIILIDALKPITKVGIEDLSRFQNLASGVGYDFEPNDITTEGLRKIGIHTIRCINVDPLPGYFLSDGTFKVAFKNGNNRLLSCLKLCRKLGATPHIVIGTGMPPELQLKTIESQSKSVLMGQHKGNLRIFGPTNSSQYISYCEAFISWVMIDQGFRNARFEYGNEPDIGGQFPFPSFPLPVNGSSELFDGYISSYQLIVKAANNIEANHKGLKVCLGGPALAWAYTFKHGDFNWGTHFIEVCEAKKIRLDFLGIHYYGNISPLSNDINSTNAYPPLSTMLPQIIDVRNKKLPTLPIWITEWGPTYSTGGTTLSDINDNSMGAAWSLEFLNTLVNNKIDGAIFLTTTDNRRQNTSGNWVNGFGWPSFFTNPTITGTAYPKATYHAFEMISMLNGYRVHSTTVGTKVGNFITSNPDTHFIRILLWNFNAIMPEQSPPIDRSITRNISLKISDASHFFHNNKITSFFYLVDRFHGDTSELFKQNSVISEKSSSLPLPNVAETTLENGQLNLSFILPPSSFALVELFVKK